MTVTPQGPKGKGKGAQTASPDRPTGPNHGPGAGGMGEPPKGKGKGTPATTKGAKPAAPPEEAGWVTVRRKRQDASAHNWQLRGNDWDAPVVQYDAVAEALQKVDGAAFKAVVLCSQDEAATLGTLLKHSGVSHAVRVVSVAPRASEGQRCPGQVDGSLAFRSVHFTEIYTNGLHVPQLAVAGALVKKVPEVPTTVLFVRFQKQFMTKAKWEEALKSPQATFHLWVSSHGLRVRDSFAWAKERQQNEVTSVFGVARVDESDAEALAALSGHEGLFLDPSRRSAFPAFATEWIDRLPKEPPLEYLARASALGSQYGLACGTRSLGRRAAKDASKPTARTWILEDTPRHWSSSQAETALATIFSDIKMLRQRRSRGGCSFSFRGSHTTNHDMVALPTENDQGQPGPVLWCRWAPASRAVQRQSIRTSGSWSLVKPTDPFCATEKVKQPVPDKQEEAPESGDIPMEATAEDQQVGGKKKAEPSTTPTVPAGKRRQVEQRIVPAGLSLATVPGDGNCLFAAFALGHARATGRSTPLHPLLLRAELVQHYLKHLDTYASQWDHEMPSGEAGTDFEAYVSEVARPKTWSGVLELKALSRMYNVRITVIPRSPTETVFSVKPSQKMHIVALMFDGQHYDALLPSEGTDMPQAVKDIIAAPPQVPMRGGGGSRGTVWTEDTGVSVCGLKPPASECGSRRSSRKRQAPASVWSSGSGQGEGSGEKRGCKAARGAATASLAPPRPGRSRCTEWTQVPPSPAGHVDPAVAALDGLVEACQSKPRRPRGRQPFCQWIQAGYARCRLCPFRVKTEDPKAAQSALAKHFRGHHKGSTPVGLGCMSVPMPSLVSTLSDDQDVAWKCPFCSKGISLEAARSAGDPRIARDKRDHKRTDHPRLSWKRWQAQDYSSRAVAATATRYSRLAKFNEQRRPHLMKHFVFFRWPRWCGAKGETQQRCPIRFEPAFACKSCHVPFRIPAAAEKHLRDKCARHFHPQTFKGFSQSRLRKLAQDRERFVASKIYGTQLEQGLALFDQAQAILEQPASPCF